MGRRGAPELYRAPFPLYAVSVPRADLVVTAGGGGASKTGISNGVHFLRLECVTGDLSATLVHAHDTETRASMNMAVAGDILAVGQDATCHILRFQEGKEKPAGNKPGTKEDKSEAEIALHSGNSSERTRKTALLKQNDCRIHRCSGTWVFCMSHKKMLHSGHVSVVAHKFPVICRFGKVEDDKDTFRLYTVQIPHKRERKPLQCYISKWDGKNFLPLLTSDCGNEVISAMSVSDLGTFIGLGTVTGSVAIYIAFSLQK
ncbi:prolactin regulatory element-binding protein [Rhincodon typus]|uniref:prolactin regulatory element-binding protein n=1 Tax=Rhincodon typus TaxID=259920 RepID=UPI00202F29F4|nr:prolactin regulatory element-binding protein [Rhincodon typus]